MSARVAFDYAPIRVVPRVERDEFVPAGLVMRCVARDYLAARVTLDDVRLRALDPDADVARIRRHLDAIVRFCAGDAAALSALSPRERWHWITAPRSTVIQIGPVHAGLSDDPAASFDRIYDQLVIRS